MGCTAAKPKPPTPATPAPTAAAPTGSPPVLPPNKPNSALQNGNHTNASEKENGQQPQQQLAGEDHRAHALFSRGESEVEELPPSLQEGTIVIEPGPLDTDPSSSSKEGKAEPEAVKPAVVTLVGAESEEMAALGKDVEDIEVSDQSDVDREESHDVQGQNGAAENENQEPTRVQVMLTESAAPPLTVEERLAKVEAVIYPSARAALASKGLQKYAAELEKRNVIDYKDLADVVEDLSDPFWNRMPAIPDRKKMRQLVEEVRVTYGLPPVTAAAAESPSAPKQQETDDLTEVSVPKEVAPDEEAPSKGNEEATAPEDAAALAAAAQAVVVAAALSAIPPASPKVEGREEPDAAAEDSVASTPPRQKTAVPCDDYETDIYATDFGMCVCGHPKKNHQFGSSNKTPSFAQRQQSKRELAPETPKDGSVCSNYTLDVKAVTFGMCVCGHPKSVHTSQANTSVNKFKEMAKGSFNKNSPMTRQASATSVEEKAPEPISKPAPVVENPPVADAVAAHLPEPKHEDAQKVAEPEPVLVENDDSAVDAVVTPGKKIEVAIDAPAQVVISEAELEGTIPEAVIPAQEEGPESKTSLKSVASEDTQLL